MHRLAILALSLFLTTTAFAQTTRYVATTGSDSGDCSNAGSPCEAISYAISVADSGDTIEIADGIYTEPDGLDIEKSLSLRGESEIGTIIQAHESPGEATSRVMTIIGTTVTVEITDLTIRHGAELGAWPEGQGGGIYNDGAMLTVTNVTLTENMAQSGGGGVFNYFSPLSVFTNVTFRGNASGMDGFGGSGGGMFNYKSSPLLRNVTFINNMAHGGGGMLNLFESSPTLIDVVFITNQANFIGGGMSNQQESYPKLMNVSFIENEAKLGGGIGDHTGGWDDGDLTLVNVVFIGNKATNSFEGGGGMYIEGSPLLINVTFTGNEASAEGGGIFVGNASNPTFVNTIVWGNTAGEAGNEIASDKNSSLFLLYSLFKNEPGDIVEGNGGLACSPCMTADPLFVDAANGNLRLQEDSPAINAGDPETDWAYFPTDTEGNIIDLDGNLRLRGGRIDIGAYEWQGDGEPGPENDHIADATVIASVNATYAGTNVNATLEDGEPEPSCTFLDWTTNHSVWWTFTAEGDANRVNINTFGSDFDTILSLHRMGNLDEVACDDDTDGVQSQIIDVVIEEGETYLIRVAGYDQSGTNQGEIQLTATFHSVSGEPGSDMFVTALTAPRPNPVRGTTAFSLTVDREQNVMVEVFDVMGRRVEVLYNGSLIAGAEESLSLDATRLSSGMYIIRATGEDFLLTQRVTVIR